MGRFSVCSSVRPYVRLFPPQASGIAGWASDLADWGSGLAGWASGLAGWASGLAGWPRGGTDVRMYVHRGNLPILQDFVPYQLGWLSLLGALGSDRVWEPLLPPYWPPLEQLP